MVRVGRTGRMRGRRRHGLPPKPRNPRRVRARNWLMAKEWDAPDPGGGRKGPRTKREEEQERKQTPTRERQRSQEVRARGSEPLGQGSPSPVTGRARIVVVSASCLASGHPLRGVTVQARAVSLSKFKMLSCWILWMWSDPSATDCRIAPTFAAASFLCFFVVHLRFNPIFLRFERAAVFLHALTVICVFRQSVCTTNELYLLRLSEVILCGLVIWAFLAHDIVFFLFATANCSSESLPVFFILSTFPSFLLLHNFSLCHLIDDHEFVDFSVSLLTVQLRPYHLHDTEVVLFELIFVWRLENEINKTAHEIEPGLLLIFV